MKQDRLRVHFDSQIFAAQAFGGISRYFASLALELSGIKDVEPKILAPLHVNGYLQALPRRLVWGEPTPSPAIPKAALRVASLVACAAMQKISSSEILHRTYYYPLCHLPGNAKNVLTVYDMIHEKFPQHFSKHDPIAGWKKKAIDNADKIICISEQTRNDLLEFNDHIAPELVSVTYLGFDALGQRLTQQSGGAFREHVIGADAPYILFVGSRGGHKNFRGLLEAYGASPWLKDNFFLLCFGGGKFTESEQKLIDASGVPHRVRQLGGSDSTLADCYGHASLFVYPSLYEGFGIPPLEAMSLNCPVACSRISSIPEVVGDAAAMFDPTDTEEMRVVLESVLNGSEAAADLAKRGQLRITEFSWRRCAEATVAIYKEVLTA